MENCSLHNDEYVGICGCERLYCKKCDTFCDKSHPVYIKGYWKKQTLIEMQKFEDKLNNKIKGLICIGELTMNNSSIIKQIEDIIDTIYVDINHIHNFNKTINDSNIPISHIIKRKNTILNKTTVISISSCAYLNEFISIINKYDDTDINVQNNNVLLWASKNGHLDVVECVIKHGADSATPNLGVAADIHAHDEYALRNACDNGHLTIIEYLITHGANIHINDDFFIRRASEYGQLSVVELLIKHGADIHALDDYAIRWASECGHLEVVMLLIKHGADVHAADDYAFYWASRNGHLAVTECLRSHEAHI